MAGSSFGCRPRSPMPESWPRWPRAGRWRRWSWKRPLPEPVRPAPAGRAGGAFDGPGAGPGAAGPGRQIRVDLRRLDALMKQVGELVVAKNRLSALATEGDDP